MLVFSTVCCHTLYDAVTWTLLSLLTLRTHPPIVAILSLVFRFLATYLSFSVFSLQRLTPSSYKVSNGMSTWNSQKSESWVMGHYISLFHSPSVILWTVISGCMFTNSAQCENNELKRTFKNIPNSVCHQGNWNYYWSWDFKATMWTRSFIFKYLVTLRLDKILEKCYGNDYRWLICWSFRKPRIGL